MKKYYRSRIMFSAMLSFLIILVLTVGAIWLISYQAMERNTDSFIASSLEPREANEDGRRFMQDTPPAMFGYNPGRRNMPSGFMKSPSPRTGKWTGLKSAASRRTRTSAYRSM